MQIHYLEIVTKDVDAVCAAYTAANSVQFGKPDAGLGNARTATLPGGQIAHPPMEIPGHGTFAIYIQGGIHHGLWQM
jgi:hypothetical protein